MRNVFFEATSLRFHRLLTTLRLGAEARKMHVPLLCQNFIGHSLEWPFFGVPSMIDSLKVKVLFTT